MSEENKFNINESAFKGLDENDESISEHLDRIAKDDIGTEMIKNAVELSDEDIAIAKEEYSPMAIYRKYSHELSTIGPLFTFQEKYDKNGDPIFETNDNGKTVPVFEKNLQGQLIIKSQAKWDNEIKYDIRRGLEAYDSFASASEKNEIVNENTIVTDSKIQQLADIILQEAIDDNATDTIIVQYEHFGVVRHFDGSSFVNQRLLYKSSVDPLITVLKKRAGLKIGLINSRAEQTNGQIVVGRANFRVASDSNQYGMFLDMRQQSVSFNSLEELNLPNNVEQVFREQIAGKDGLTIVGGPPGSGKTTLMTTGLVEYQRETQGAANILSLEQPIETPTPGIIQKDIDEDYGVTWDGAINAALREKPQIIRVGETSTKESAKAIVRAANVGIVALTTLHIQSAIEVFETLKSLGVSESDIKNSLKLVVYLNRVPKLCPHCKIENSILLNERINEWVKRHLNDSRSGGLDVYYERRKEGCEVCRAKTNNPQRFGTLGMVSVYEYLKVNRPMLRIYRKYADQDAYVLKEKLLHPETIQWDLPDDPDSEVSNKEASAGLEYYSLERDILSKMQNGDIDFETARYLTNE